ncbi:MAG: helix-turn-helix transcriptional regulator [Cyanobacteria bacterium SBLK]|nr:helix-turn-helix transcriptional regulator [Cyanobacteria bacterium SBLK]
MDAKLGSEEAVRALAALAQMSRLAIFRLLVRQGPEGMPAGKIAKTLNIPLATLSFHLQQLSQARLVCACREGRYIIYSAHYQQMNALIYYLTENCCRGIDDLSLSSENSDPETLFLNNLEEVVK